MNNLDETPGSAPGRSCRGSPRPIRST